MSKISDDSIVRGTNEQGQNLYHTFALKGNGCPHQIATKIHRTFMDKQIDFKAKDNKGRTPLHYAALSNFRFLMQELLAQGSPINAQDNDGLTPFALQLIQPNSQISNFIHLYIINHADFNLKFRVKYRGEEIEMGPLTYLVSKGSKNIEIIKLLLSNGISINETDENGRNALMYAIRQNSRKLVEFLLNYPELDKKHKDNDGKTPIHHVVNPVEFGSFENTEILELLAPYFDLNEKDEMGKSPIYYAYLQDSGVMAAKLRELGAIDNKPPANITRGATSVIGNVEWPEEEINYEEDAEKYLEKVEKAEKNKMEEEKPDIVRPDKGCKDQAQYEVYYDEKLGAYDLYMTKVEIDKGPWGGNLYYKMQILHNKVRDYYCLLTRYGRIGEEGVTQITPFPTKEDALQEFHKIFKSKTGNEWEDKDNFERVPKKYRLLRFAKRKNYREHLVPFDLSNSKVPQSELEDEIKKIMKDVSDISMYHHVLGKYQIDTDVLPLAHLDKALILEAQQLLTEIQDVQREIDQEEKLGMEKKDVGKILELQEKILENSNKFFELIPDQKFRTESVEPLQRNQVNGKLKMVEDLLDVEISTKILLGKKYFPLVF